MLLLTVLFACCAVLVTSLRLEDVDEGDCSRTQYQPVSTDGADLLGSVSSFSYIPAGSSYELYTFATTHPRFRQMRENELRDTMCLTHNGTDAVGRGAGFGFGGRVLGTYVFAPKAGQTAVFEFTFFPGSSSVPLLTATHTVSLTDFSTFAFFTNCVTIAGSQHKTWRVVSNTPNLSASARKQIEEHAASLGFNRKNFLFLNYDSCDAGVGGRPEYNQVSLGTRPDNWGNNGANRGWVSRSGGRRSFSRQYGWRK